MRTTKLLTLSAAAALVLSMSASASAGDEAAAHKGETEALAGMLVDYACSRAANCAGENSQQGAGLLCHRVLWKDEKALTNTLGNLTVSPAGAITAPSGAGTALLFEAEFAPKTPAAAQSKEAAGRAKELARRAVVLAVHDLRGPRSCPSVGKTGEASQPQDEITMSPRLMKEILTNQKVRKILEKGS